MSASRDRGMVLIWVILALLLMGMTTASLASLSHMLTCQTDRACASAVRRNLQASARAWVARALADPNRVGSEPVDLDVGALTTRPASLRITLGESDAEIRTSCSWARQTVEGCVRDRY